MCGNPECDKLTRGSNKYCSFRCRNVVINSKMDYTKMSKKFRDSYEENPKICKNCGSKISYERHRDNKTTVYCSNICGNISGSNFHKGLKRSVETRLNISKSLEIINDEKYKTTRKKCQVCGNKIKKRSKFCSRLCLSKSKINKNEDVYLFYKKICQFKFSLNNFKDEFDFDLIINNGWYSPSNSKNPNLSGISRDHMLSIRDGFEKGINPYFLSHPANCRLLIHKENISKNKKSILTECELFNRIKKWEYKYGKFHNFDECELWDKMKDHIEIMKIHGAA